MRIERTVCGLVAIVSLALLLAGCPAASEPDDGNGAEPAAAADDEHAGHDHPTEGPHGGHLIELGAEEYHAELLHDESAHSVTVHLLDAAGKAPVAVALPYVEVQLFREGQFVSYELAAVAPDAAGQTSEFVLADESLCNAFHDDKELRGRLHVTINDKPFVATIEHHAHDHEGHDHDHEGHDHDGPEHDDEGHGEDESDHKDDEHDH